MNIELKPDLEAILAEQVRSGHFASIEEALEAAVRGLAADAQGDLSWAKPYLDEADKDIAEGRTVSHDEVWARMEKRFGKN